jgi:uncharacterized protein (TIGR02171 family)
MVLHCAVVYELHLGEFFLNVQAFLLGVSMLVLGCSGVNSSKAEESSSAKASSGAQSSEQNSITIPGMLTIAAAGELGYMGSKADSAAWSQKPYTVTRFTYDFTIGITEVTVQEFYALMPWIAQSQDTTQHTHPIANISWYDAALYCNELSKQYGLDTVYSYKGRSVLASGHTYNLEALQVHFDRDGVRLPTEAEWMFAASAPFVPFAPVAKNEPKVWAEDGSLSNFTNYAWTAENAQGGAQAVDQKERINGLADLPGNVMEWVGDWLAALPGDTVRDYVGPNSPVLEYARVLKGGSYAHDKSYAKITNRSDVYLFTSAARAPYLGFRVARGAILEPTYKAAHSQVQLQHANLLVSRERIQQFLGTQDAKMVYVDHQTGYLSYLDFKNLTQGIVQFVHNKPVKHPKISPNGQWVVYSTASEGQSVASEIYIRSLKEPERMPRKLTNGAIPRWWVSPSAQDTFLVYVSSAISNADSTNWLQESTYLQKIQNGFLKGEALPLAAGTFHSGFAPDSQFLVTAYPKLLVQNVPNSASVQQLFTSPQNGKTSEGSNQVCNASLSPNGETIAFIDFGYTQESSFTGGSYGVHEFLFTANRQGKLQQYYPTPKGYKGWAHPEWSNHSDFIISNFTDDQDVNSGLGVLNTKDKSIEIVANGIHFAHPDLWVQPNKARQQNQFAYDSLFAYHIPLYDSRQLDITARLPLLLEQRDSLQVVALGSSHASVGFHPFFIDAPALNLGFAGARLQDQYQLYADYLHQGWQGKVLLVSLDIGWWNDEMEVSYWDASIRKSLGYQYDKSHNFWKAQSGPGYLAWDLGYSHRLIDSKTSFWENICVDWGEEQPKLALRPEMDWEHPTQAYLDKMELLHKIIALAAKDQVKTVGVLYPESAMYSKTDYWGLYGPPNHTAQKVIEDLQNLMATNPNFYVIDEHQNGTHEYASDMFHDQDHLCSVGAKVFTQRVNQFLLTHGLIE